jgi:hypothetical protein
VASEGQGAIQSAAIAVQLTDLDLHHYVEREYEQLRKDL